MDISVIYELKNRLRASAIAGASLVSEDFRLKKAVENFAALSGANPVFGRIYELSRKLLDERTPEALLDAITLTDSVITTLAPSETAEMKSAEPEALGGAPDAEIIADVPYSKLSALIGALTTSGSGNYSTFMELKNNEPRLLRDYRVKAALVKALGASYSELAAEAEEALKEIGGDDIIRLLKKDFDPKGKKDMQRRLAVIESLAGAAENDFYLSQAENAEKDMRRFLIYALRHDERNFDVLESFAKTEKGKVRDAAYYALANFSDGRCADIFREIAAKKPEKALEYLRYTTSDWSSKLTAELLRQYLTNEDGSQDTLDEALSPKNFRNQKDPNAAGEYFSALCGKTGAEIESIYRAVKSDESAEAVGNYLADTIVRTDDPALRQIAIELNSNRKMKNRYIYAELVARLTGGEDCSAWLAKLIKGLKDSDFETQQHYDPVVILLHRITLKNGEFYLSASGCDGVYDKMTYFPRRIDQPIKDAPANALMKFDAAGNVLARWIDPSDAEFSARLGEYFTRLTRRGINFAVQMGRCGVRNVKGLAVDYFRNKDYLDSWLYRSFFRELPGDYEYKLDEAKALAELVRRKKFKTYSRDPIDGDEIINWCEVNLK